MSGSHPSRWLIFLVSGALTALGCVGTTDTGSQGETGSLSVDLVLADGLVIDEVSWQITGNGMDMSGDVDVSAPGSTASVEVFGLPPGETDYTVTLTATSNDEKVTCEGSAPFNVEVGQSTDVMVMLNCKKPRTLGGVRVNGKFNICTQLTKTVVSPLQTSVGNDISLAAQAFDEEGDAISYSWTGTGGSIADPTAPSTTYTCQDVGQHTVTIMVTDNDVYCRMATWTVPVTCVEGDGGDLCEDVMCEDDGNECTVTECNPANGACETSNVEDGTDCDGGTCAAGECVEENLCEGVTCENDGNECTETECDPADGVCKTSNATDGTECASGDGMCVGGVCVLDDLCEGVTCDDTGNECTVAMCNNTTGECDTMNVTDGTECNGGAGACSGGVCIDDNLCDGVDCTSANDCVQNGTCDPASGECLPGEPQPVDTACTSNGGTVCDGAGACVACNAASQCPDDGNDCTAAACETNACVQNNVMNGQACDFGGSDGICEAGTCVEAPDCTMDAQCDDGNPCTVGACPDGMCVFSQASDGTACEVSAGVPGTCTVGDCVGLCENVDCSTNNQCRVDPTCDPADGQCKGGSDEPIDTPCDQGGGAVCDGSGNCVGCNNDMDCGEGEVCENSTCMTAQEPSINAGVGDTGYRAAPRICPSSPGGTWPYITSGTSPTGSCALCLSNSCSGGSNATRACTTAADCPGGNCIPATPGPEDCALDCFTYVCGSTPTILFPGGGPQGACSYPSTSSNCPVRGCEVVSNTLKNQLGVDTLIFLEADSAGPPTRELTLSYEVQAYNNALGLAAALAVVNDVTVVSTLANANPSTLTNKLDPALAGLDVSDFLVNGVFVIDSTQLLPTTEVVTPTASPVTVAFDESQFLMELVIKSSGAPLDITGANCTFSNEAGTCIGGQNSLRVCDPSLPNGGTGTSDCSVPDIFGDGGLCVNTGGAAIPLPATIP